MMDEDLLYDLRNSEESLDTILKKHNTNLREIMNKEKLFNKKSPQKAMYCYEESNGSYRVQRTIKGKCVNYGRYPSKRIARQVVEELKKVNWNIKKLPAIKEKLNEL